MNTMIEIEAIRHCPFCGGTPTVCNNAPDARDQPWIEQAWWLECEECGVGMSEKPTETEAVAAWNRRVDQ